MKFKITKTSPLFKKLQDVKNKSLEAHEKAITLAEKYGFKQYRQENFCLAGGISSLYAKTKPSGFMLSMGKKYPNDFFPKKIKKNEKFLAEIEALPKVQYEDLNKIIKYDGTKSKEGKDGGLRISFTPAVDFKKNVILVSVPEFIKYKPVTGMTEITTKEYEKLLK